jgi:hypothetical protein
MAQGKSVCLSRTLKRVLPLLAVAVPLASLEPAPPTEWWEARLALSVRGDYMVKGPQASFTGEFAYGARWTGILERDGIDVLLYHTRISDESWEVREKAVRPEGTRLLTEKDGSKKPKLSVNYILRVDRDLLFDVSVEGVKIPLGPWPNRFDLELPCSKEHGGAPSGGYDDFITKGTNRIAIGVDGLEKGSLEKSFSWGWKRERWTAAGSGTVWLAGSHEASVIVTLIRHH